MNSTDISVETYLAKVHEQHVAHINALHDTIVSLYPDATVDMKYKMPTYHQNGAWVAIASQKNYVSLYTCSADHIAAFKQKHPHYKTGKGCINFKKTDALPLADIEAVVRHAMQQIK